MSNFNQEQLEFIKSDVSDATLVGIPGGGKSTCISEYGKDKYTRNILRTNEILYLMFNKDAQLSLHKKLKPFLKKDTFVRTLDSITYKACKDNDLDKYIDKDFESFPDKSDYFAKKKWAFVQSIKYTPIEKIDIDYLKSIKLIIVDEAQDINFEDYTIIEFLVKRLKCKLIYVGDGNQNIYSDMKDSTSRYMDNHIGNTFKLKLNYRSTNQIVNFANYYRLEENEMISANNTDNDLPLYITSESMNKTYADISQRIKTLVKNGYSFKDISIAVKTKDLGDEMKVVLEREEIIVVNRYSKDESINKDGVRIYTYWKMKGLENKVVILHNFGSWEVFDFSDYTWEPYDFELLTRIKYVGVTRAQEKLFIYYDRINFTSKRKPRRIQECEIIRNIPQTLYNREYL